MKITEEDGCKKATCTRCKQVVVIPAGETGSRILRRQRRSEISGFGEHSPDSTRFSSPEAHPGEETRTGPGQALHEIVTRVEHPHSHPDDLTSMLAPPEAADELGRLGGYRVLSIVGAGGMGVVFRAHDPQLDRIVALKVMLPTLATSATARQRFLREAKAAAALQHDFVVTIFQVGETRGVPFLAMPFLKGESLDARLRRLGSALGVGESLRIARQIAEGLSALHELGLVHRDIKPANVFLEGEASRVKILDFGLARAVTGDPQLTQEGTIVGSPAFMAPEQATRQMVDARADLFSLGCVMYLMLTGKLPFEGDDAVTMLLAVQTASPKPPCEYEPAVPIEVSDLVIRLLRKKPGDRPDSARQVIEAIDHVRRA
jgi:serine/threonine protein kinase